MHHPVFQRSQERGNVLFYIFLCVALIGVLTFVLSDPGGGESASGSTAFRNSEDMKSQAQGARSAIMECFLIHNAGYPTEPGSHLLSDVTCDTPNGAQNIFTAQSARAMPIPPKPFGVWNYKNTGSDFIRISTSSAKPADPVVQMTLRNIALGFRAPAVATDIYQSADVCIIADGSKAEFHACLKSSTGVCGKTSGTDRCEP